jgi:DNA modification methylase
MPRAKLPYVILEGDALYRQPLTIHHVKTCECPAKHLNCLTAKEWTKSQLGVWQFAYEGRDIRDKALHPATFPISLAKKIISLYTHEGELVVDPFVGSGTTLVAAQDLKRNAVGFDLNERKNEQFGKVEQYSQDPRDLGTMPLDEYTRAMGDILKRLLPLLRPKAHCVINVPDMWWENQRIAIHVSIVEELRRREYELRNIIIWDRTNIVNRIGIFGWPSNYITMGTTFEYLLDFWRPLQI